MTEREKTEAESEKKAKRRKSCNSKKSEKYIYKYINIKEI